MQPEPQRWQRLLVCGAVTVAVSALLIHAGGPTPAAAALSPIKSTTLSATSLTPGFAGYLHRLLIHTERSSDRAVSFLTQLGALWVWIVLSLGAFLLVTAFSSIADLRMWELRRQGVRQVGRYINHGMRTFFRILGDRRTPFSARTLLAAALVYWLLPLDLIDDSSLPGFIDDLVVAVVCAKGFMHLCPDTLVAAHAAAVEARA